MSIVLAALLTLTGCTTMKDGEFDVRINSNSLVQITNVSVQMENGEIVVSGNLRPISSAATRTGHLDIAFIGADGTVLDTVSAIPSSNMFLRNSRNAPAFSTKAEITGVAAVQVTHHPDTMNECDL